MMASNNQKKLSSNFLTVCLTAAAAMLITVGYAANGNTPSSSPSSQMNFAKITLQNGTQLSGVMNQNPQTGAITLAHVNNQGQRVVETLNPTFVKNVTPAQQDPKTLQAMKNTSPLVPPIETVVHLKQGNVVHGQMAHSPNAQGIVVKEEGKQEPTHLSWENVIRISQVEKGQAGASQPPQQRVPQQPQGAGQPQAQQPQRPPSPQAPQQQPQAAPVATIHLAEGSTITGQMVPNPGMGLITVFSTNQENKPVVDYIQSRFVQKVEPVQDQSEKPQSPQQLAPPIQAKLWLITGEEIEGQYVPHQQVGLYMVIPEGQKQPHMYPMHYVPRLQLTQGEKPAGQPAQPEQPSQQSQKSTSSNETHNKVRESTYTSIPVQPMPSNPPQIPDEGTKVQVQTNLGQVFEGVIQSKEGGWITLETTKVADMELSPARISVINQNHIVSLETL